jgi:sugar/nucleoside kinase (ribokinase family)
MNNRVLFIGLTTLDIQYFLESFPLPNTKHKTKAPLIAAGGPAANAAITYAWLGGKPDFFTCIGLNPFTDFLINDFEKHGVKTTDLLTKHPYQPIVATVITNTTNSDRTIITHHPDIVNIETELLEIDFTCYDFVFIDGFYPEIAIPICKRARSLGITVVLDGGSWKPQTPSLLPFVDVAICSENFVPSGCSSYREIIDFTMKQGVQLMAITRGGESIVTNLGEVKIERVGGGRFAWGRRCASRCFCMVLWPKP